MKNKLIKFFLSVPIALAVFYAPSSHAYSSTLTVGLSGSNWTLRALNSVSVSGTSIYPKGCASIYNGTAGTSTLIAGSDGLVWTHGGYPLTTSTQVFFDKFDTTSLNDGTYTFVYRETTANCDNPEGKTTLADARTFYGVGGDTVFTINRYAQIVVSTSTIAYGPFQTFATSGSYGYVSVNTTSSPFYVDCSAYNDIPFFASGTVGGIWCNAKKTMSSVAEWLLVPPDFAQSYWTNSLNSIQNVPPFSIVKAAVDSFQQSAGLAASSTPNYSELNLTLPGGHITNQPILSANMLKNWLTTADCNDACAAEKKDTFFSYFSAVIWLGAGLKILTFIF